MRSLSLLPRRWSPFYSVLFFFLWNQLLPSCDIFSLSLCGTWIEICVWFGCNVVPKPGRDAKWGWGRQNRLGRGLLSIAEVAVVCCAWRLMSLKLDGFLRPYRGSGDDWEQVWSKFTVLAEVSGWYTEAKMMARFPLLIEGPAFLVFSKMAEGDKKKKEKVQELMLTSFSLSKAYSYRAFQQRVLRLDETPDENVADLRRLLAMAGYATPNDDKGAIVVEQLLSGLPKKYDKELRLSCAGKEKTLSGCLELVRALREADGDSHAGHPMLLLPALVVVTGLFVRSSFRPPERYQEY